MAKKTEKKADLASAQAPEVLKSPRNQVLELKKVAQEALQRAWRKDPALESHYSGKITAYEEVLQIL